MSIIFHREVTITARDCGTYNQCKPSSVLGILQDCATMAADQMGVSHHVTITKYQAVWMVARLWYQLSEPIYYGDVLTIETWHRGGNNPFLYRDYEIYRNGQLVGEGLALWVLYGLESGKMLRMSAVTMLEDTHGGERRKTRVLRKIKPPTQLKDCEKRRVHYSDLDINGHVNNVKYVDMVCDAVELENMTKEQFVTSLQMDYNAQCFPKEEIALKAGQGEQEGYVVGLDKENTPRFSGLLTINTIS